MDKKDLEDCIKDFRTCMYVYDTFRAVKPEWSTPILKHCMELAVPHRKTEIETIINKTTK